MMDTILGLLQVVSIIFLSVLAVGVTLISVSAPFLVGLSAIKYLF